jgi:PHP family Zn ribbon phosphoesterase
MSTTCAACALLSDDDLANAGWACGSCGSEFTHADGVHDVQYGIYHEFTCHACAERESIAAWGV